MAPISLEELNWNIKELDANKAEGLDGVTNDILRHSGPLARQFLTQMFNNVMIGGVPPASWKDGDVILVLKKPPQTEISNYRPITLISCISKLLTKILAKRLGDLIAKEDIIGAEQNGFRSSRTCSDNIFILNSVLEMNKSKKLLSHIMFIDLQEAYDRVDRDILLAKLKQLNISSKFIDFLSNYYFLDNISTASSGKRTRKQYQKRGLRQGCNLSSVLFIIYMSELSRRMRAAGVGVRLESGVYVNILLFADDIILIANSPETLNQLKDILESWCLDFRMKISINKTKIITSLDDLECALQDPETLESEIVEHVSNYKYLGVQQYSSMWKTSQKKGESMLSKAKCYKNVILRSRHSLLDNISAASAMWKNIAIPGILYATDAIPISNTVIEELEVVQNQIGKALLGVPQSTANTVVQAELGWKPVRLLLELSKLRFFQRVYGEDFKGSEILKTCMQWCLSAQDNQYRKNLFNILGHHANSPEDLGSITRKQLIQVYELKILSQIQEMVTLKLLPIPRKWWTIQNHVENSRWSQMLSKFRSMNAGLGNRDAFRTADSVCQDGGRILQCPLCFMGSNDELHLLIKCESMEQSRSEIKLLNGDSLQATLMKLRLESRDDFEACRMFLGQDKSLRRTDLADRGLALDILLDRFFLEWSKIRGKAVHRSTQ